MTVEKQNISEDFYIGNYKLLAVTVYQDEDLTVLKDLTGAELTYVWVTRDDEVLLVKSSQYPTQINITVAADGECEIYILAVDTALFDPGVYYHHLNVVDGAGKEETVFTGKVTLLKSYAQRPRKSYISACIVGG